MFLVRLKISEPITIVYLVKRGGRLLEAILLEAEKKKLRSNFPF